ncbi:Uncharacterized protein YydD, contains DUF2326 domain [Geodermatophilus siccatus]|uniref:Uncharacterized protein YydD, contains DUF2326 domain n=1 Tax=Geodermatophilus siccatus TaxID=1137991 RepID=A0A1H0BT18_9ACTN|nr:DUF2326 domain-containing protein [Geodermatophilus siccatus]SDN48768.1 Uncharacterized protein YydD, contains DUF2326 domain [Geodermatophilus siccatus]
MIRLESVSANQDSFHAVTFKSNFNVIMADRTPESRDVDTRNGAGKTTLLQIIDFCLGARLGDFGALPKLTGKGWEFTRTFLLRGYDDQLPRVSVTRSIDEPARLVLEGDLQDAGIVDEPVRRTTVTAGILTDWLGERLFGLKPRSIRDEGEPTFRRLFAHFLRYRNESYLSPFETFSRQSSADIQSANTFLLDLDWRLASEWQRLKDREKRLNALGRQGVEEVGQEIADLESLRARLETRLRRLRNQVAEFRVLDEYREIETRANDLTSRLQRLANDRSINQRLLHVYETQLGEEVSGDLGAEQIVDLFNAAKVELGDAVVRRLSDVVSFHEQIARNRRDYLESEVRRLRQVDAQLTSDIERLDEERRTDMRLLATTGAIDDFGALQQRVGQAAAELESVERRLAELRELRAGKARLRLDRLDLQERVSRDLDERRLRLGEIAADFSDIFELLYDEPADLVVDAGAAGYRFRTNLPRGGSHGVDKVAIFALDLALVTHWTEAGKGPGVLLHDSILFDGVDERQVVKALSLAEERSTQAGFQYILTLNSDRLPAADTQLSTDLREAVVLQLTDKSDEGRLLGVRV